MARKKTRASTWGTVRKLPSGNWQARYVNSDGARVNAPQTFQTRAQAQGWLDLRHAEILTGTALLAPEMAERKPKLPPTPTVTEWARRYMEDGVASGWSPNTERTFKSRIEKHVLPVFGEVPISEVTPDQIQTWWRNTPWKSNYQQYNAYMVISALFRSAVKRGVIEKTPVQIEGTKRLIRQRRELTIATPEQVRAIAAAMPDGLAITVLIGAWCGLRFGEIAALQRKDVDLKEATITVRGTTRRGIGGHESVGAPKSDAGLRTVAVPLPCLVALRSHMAAHVGKSRDALIVHQPGDPERWLSNRKLHEFFNPACEQAGLPGFRFHDLRHTGLTMAAQAGATIAELMARAGHSSPDMALRYQHASLERDRAIAARMAELAEG